MLTLDGCEDGISRCCFFRTKIVDNSCTCFLKHPRLSACMREERKRSGEVYEWCRGLKTDPGSSLVFSCLVCSEDWTQVMRFVWQALLPVGSSHWPHAHFKFFFLFFFLIIADSPLTAANFLMTPRILPKYTIPYVTIPLFKRLISIFKYVFPKIVGL